MSAQKAVALCRSKPEKDVIFVDVRQPENFEKGAIKGAVHMFDIFTYLLPTSAQSDLDTMKKHFTDLMVENGIKGTDKEHVVVYEDGLNKLYGASCRGFLLMKSLGLPFVSVLEGGYDGVAKLSDADRAVLGTWRNPANKDDAAAFKYSEEWIVGYQQVLDTVNGKKNAKLLDVRDEVEWVGKSSSPYGVDFTPRKGRIPGAKWIEWYKFMEGDGDKMVNQEKIEEMMTAEGFEKDDEIIVYCFKGARASNTLMMLKECGYKNVSNYFPSWNEWSRNMDLPIDDEVLESV